MVLPRGGFKTFYFTHPPDGTFYPPDFTVNSYWVLLQWVHAFMSGGKVCAALTVASRAGRSRTPGLPAERPPPALVSTLLSACDWSRLPSLRGAGCLRAYMCLAAWRACCA